MNARHFVNELPKQENSKSSSWHITIFKYTSFKVYKKMKFKLETNNKSKSPLKKVFFDKIIRETLLEVGWEFLKKKNISLSLAMVGKKEIKEINKKYRRINAVTDILSFAEYKSERDLRKGVEKNKDKELFLGELILCYDDIKEYAKKEKLNLKEECAKVVSHGLLHLLGMKHGKKMFSIQSKAAKN